MKSSMKELQHSMSAFASFYQDPSRMTKMGEKVEAGCDYKLIHLKAVYDPSAALGMTKE